MSGPIIRTGATPEFWNNWDNVFGKKSKAAAKTEVKASSPKKEDKPTDKKKASAPQAAKKVAAKKAVAKKTSKKK